MLSHRLLPARLHSHSQPYAWSPLPLPSLQTASPQLAQPRGRACWQSSAFDFFFFFYVLWTNPISGAAFWAKVCSISPGQMQEGVTLQTPPPYMLLHHLFLTTQPFNHTSPRNAVEVALVILPVVGNKSTRVQKGSTNLCIAPSVPVSLPFLFPPFSLVSGPILRDCQPTQESSRTAWWITLHPQAKHSTRSNNYTNRHGHVPTHIYSPLNLTFHLCIN